MTANHNVLRFKRAAERTRAVGVERQVKLHVLKQQHASRQQHPRSHALDVDPEEAALMEHLEVLRHENDTLLAEAEMLQRVRQVWC